VLSIDQDPSPPHNDILFMIFHTLQYYSILPRNFLWVNNFLHPGLPYSKQPGALTLSYAEP